MSMIPIVDGPMRKVHDGQMDGWLEQRFALCRLCDSDTLAPLVNPCGTGGLDFALRALTPPSRKLLPGRTNRSTLGQTDMDLRRNDGLLVQTAKKAPPGEKPKEKEAP